MKSATSGATSFYQLILQLMKLDKHYYLRDFFLVLQKQCFRSVKG